MNIDMTSFHLKVNCHHLKGEDLVGNISLTVSVSWILFNAFTMLVGWLVGHLARKSNYPKQLGAQPKPGLTPQKVVKEKKQAAVQK